MATCRICWDSDGELLSPCACRGSLAHIHADCALEAFCRRAVWLDVRCQVCKRPYHGHLAASLAEIALQNVERHYGPFSLKTSRALRHLASAHHSLGQYELMRKALSRALQITESHYSPQDSHVLTAKVHLGQAHLTLGDSGTAQVIFKGILDVQKQQHAQGENQVDVLYSMAHVLASGSMRKSRGNLEASRDIMQTVLSIFERKHGAHTVKTAQVSWDLGIVSHNLGECALALPMLQRCVDILTREYGADHPLTVGRALEIPRLQSTTPRARSRSRTPSRLAAYGRFATGVLA